MGTQKHTGFSVTDNFLAILTVKSKHFAPHNGFTESRNTKSFINHVSLQPHAAVTSI